MSKPKPPASRIAILKERVAAAEAAKEATFDVPFRKGRVALRRIQVETSFPLYRIQSGRTRNAQDAYLDEHPELPSTFFKDPEDEKVQKAQQGILLRMINEKDLELDIRERGQLAPLVLTKDGYVVDGNRRLATLRSRKEQYATAVVLPPDAEAHEIYDTEIELQLQRETKADYGWINNARQIEYGIKELSETVVTLAKRMRISEQDLTRELEKLNLARLYLAWLGQPGKHHLIPETGGGQTKQSFEDMARHFGTPAVKRKSEQEKRLIREGCFQVIKRGQGYQEIRRVLKHLTQSTSKVSQRLKERLPPPKNKPTPPPSKGAKKTDGDPLRALSSAASVPANPEVDLLHSAISDSDKSSIVLDIIEDIDAEEKESKRQQLPLQRVQRAAAELAQVSLTKDTEELPAIGKALAQVSKQVDRLAVEIEKAKGKK